jgi:hypothetical protein
MVTLLNACLVDGYGALEPAGWSRLHTGTNAIALSALGGKSVLQVDDNGATSANKTRMRCFRSMSEVSSGSNAAIGSPNNGSIGGSVLLIKSSTTSSTARPWVVIADENTVHVLVDQNSSGRYTVFSFGEYDSYVPGDDQNVIISGLSSNTATADQGGVGMRNSPTLGVTGFTGSNTAGFVGNTWGYSSRFDGLGCALDTIGDITRVGNVSSIYALGNFTPAVLYPDLLNGDIRVGKIYLSESSVNIVGSVRGVYEPLHKLQSADFNMTGTLVKPTYGELSGKTLEFFAVEGGGHALFETSDTWI